MTSPYRSHVASIRWVWAELAALIVGLHGLGVGLIMGEPAWLLVMLAFFTGGLPVFALCDYRDVLRHRAGVLTG